MSTYSEHNLEVARLSCCWYLEQAAGLDLAKGLKQTGYGPQANQSLDLICPALESSRFRSQHCVPLGGSERVRHIFEASLESLAFLWWSH